ncbi:MAG: RNA polymerase sigma factor [Verrucomicrobiaceae bacterium]|nr:MAG: RNA polymerase sigma factor [Verrucomicrobiaceae bacterium]
MADAGVLPVIPFRQSKPAPEVKPTLRQVFDAEESPLLRYAHGIVGQRETAEDLVQEAFLKLHAHWEEVTHPRAWLFRCIRNLALSHIRDHKRETAIPEDHEFSSNTPEPDQTLGKLEAIGALQLLISELDEDDRTLITLKYNEGLKYDQISQRTGLSIGNVGYKLHHALKNLADSLRRLGVESPEG